MSRNYIYKDTEYKVGMLVVPIPDIIKILPLTSVNLKKVYKIEGFKKLDSNGMGWVLIIKIDENIETFHPCYFEPPIESRAGAILYGN